MKNKPKKTDETKYLKSSKENYKRIKKALNGSNKKKIFKSLKEFQEYISLLKSNSSEKIN